MSEAALAEKVVAFLEDQRWDVYQEVGLPGGIADIVATQGIYVWVVEVKKSLSLAVMAQAESRTRQAHYVSVAVPRARASDARFYAKRILARDGVGVIEVSAHGVSERVQPSLHRAAHVQAVKLRGSLCEEHKTFAKAGTNGGGRWTPFQRTVQLLSEIVSEQPGISVKDAVTQMDHHYANAASAKSSLLQWIDTDVIPGVEARRDGKRILLHPVKVAL